MDREVTNIEREAIRAIYRRHREHFRALRQRIAFYRRLFPLYLKPVGTLAMSGVTGVQALERQRAQ